MVGVRKKESHFALSSFIKHVLECLQRGGLGNKIKISPKKISIIRKS